MPLGAAIDVCDRERVFGLEYGAARGDVICVGTSTDPVDVLSIDIGGTIDDLADLAVDLGGARSLLRFVFGEYGAMIGVGLVIFGNE